MAHRGRQNQNETYKRGLMNFPFNLRQANQEIVALMTAAHHDEAGIMADLLNSYSPTEITQLLVATIGWMLNTIHEESDRLGLEVEEVLASFGEYFASMAED
jgi:hypothetical protein